ncbi:DUF4870 domain-containing protein [Sphingobacterium sp. SGR-19]|uniref:DUF4870 domain-containing protein n=1 Tax=Sphingobacterium sp. SGR-19 TaxID=2710886 RepID=UPI0013EDE571|nr:DUF4870 domain-containing protein [Sphingobacterium sp. SGR-19]NGM65652.1 DUF4870 domain-containing protein [Sphingobacterium sp. SGR-19]
MNAKVQSILSYIGIAWLIAYFGGKKERNDFSRYHLKQGLGLWIIAIWNVLVSVVSVISASIAVLLSYVGFIFLVLMIMGIIHAVNNVKKPLPVVGVLFEDKFDFINNS